MMNYTQRFYQIINTNLSDYKMEESQINTESCILSMLTVKVGSVLKKQKARKKERKKIFIFQEFQTTLFQ